MQSSCSSSSRWRRLTLVIVATLLFGLGGPGREIRADSPGLAIAGGRSQGEIGAALAERGGPNAPAAPALTVMKSLLAPADRAVLLIGETVRFQATVQNTGASTIVYLPLEDQFDRDCLAYAPKTAVPLESYHSSTAGSINWVNLVYNAGVYLAPGESFTVTMPFSVVGPSLAGYNRAIVDGAVDEADQPAPAASSEVAFTCVPPASIGDLVWDDRDGDGQPDAGEPGLSGIELRLTHPDGSVITTTTTVAGFYTFAMLPPGAYTVAVDAATLPAGYVPTSLASPLAITLGAGQQMMEADFGYQAQPVLAIAKTPDMQYASGGDAVTFTLAVANTGPTALASLTLTDTYDAACMTLLAADPAPSAQGPGEARWEIGPLPIAATAWITTVFRADQVNAVCVNNALAAGVDIYGVHAGPARDDAAVQTGERPVIGVAKQVASIAASGLGTYTVAYTITVNNLGDVPLANVQATDDLAVTFAAADSFALAGLSSAHFSVNPAYTGITPNTALLTGADSLGVGLGGTIELTVTLTPGVNAGPYFNQVLAQGTSPLFTTVWDLSDNGFAPDPDGNGDPGGLGENDPTPLNFNATSAISITKTGPATAWAGVPITYVLTVINAGDTPLASVTVADIVCGGTTYVTGDTDSNGLLDVTETWTFTCTHRVRSTDPDPLINTAIAWGVDPLSAVVSAQGSWNTDLLTIRLGDRTWLDADGDGVEEPLTETVGVPFVPLRIKGVDLNGVTVEITVTTSITGHYAVDLRPGVYTVTAPAQASGASATSPLTQTRSLLLGGLEDLTVDFGYQTHTAVSLLAFDAANQPAGRVLVRWTAGPATNVEGFLLFRAAKAAGPYKQLTPTPIAALPIQADYQYLDKSGLDPREVYWYKLQTLPGDEWLGPIASAPYFGDRLFVPLVSR